MNCNSPLPSGPIPEDIRSPVTSASMRRWLWGGMAICTVLWLALPLGFKFAFSLPFPTSMNEFGDSFGGVSALFSALTMAGVIYSLLLQRDDIKLTLAELQSSAKAQQDLANNERENLAANRSLIEIQKQTSQAMSALFEEQTAALRQQVRILEEQKAAATVATFKSKFDRRLELWLAVREQIGTSGLRGQEYIHDNVEMSKDGKSWLRPVVNPTNPSSLPYDFLSGNYMRNFKAVVLMFSDPFFLALPHDEQEEMKLKLGAEICDPERLVLLHLYLDKPEPSKPGSQDAKANAEKLKLAIARANALGGISKIAEKCLPQAQKSYRDCVKGLAESAPLVA